jgi:hypothetical protein
MSCWDVEEIVQLARDKIKCPVCINGPIEKGWNNDHKVTRARVLINVERGGVKYHALFQKVINCKRHGAQIKEVEM